MGRDGAPAPHGPVLSSLPQSWRGEVGEQQGQSQPVPTACKQHLGGESPGAAPWPRGALRFHITLLPKERRAGARVG